MKKIFIVMCLALCLSGCNKSNTDSNIGQTNTLAEEIQMGLETLKTTLLTTTALDDIRETIQSGELVSNAVQIVYNDTILSYPELTADLKPVTDSLEVGYDWSKQEYTCIYKVTSETRYAYVTAMFNTSFECIDFFSSTIMEYPYIGETNTSIPGMSPSGYNPLPPRDNPDDIDWRLPKDDTSSTTSDTSSDSTSSSDTSTPDVTSSSDTNSDATSILNETSLDTSTGG